MDFLSFNTPETIARIAGVSVSTATRWRANHDSIPAPAARLLSFFNGGDCAALFGAGWRDIRLSPAGLHLPGWRGPIPVGELRAAFWRLQQVGQLGLDLDRARRDRLAAQEAQQLAEDAAAWYRGQLVLESRLGAMLARVAA